jgi:hypothetical protein
MATIPVHPLISAIEFILKQFAQKLLRHPYPSASLLMDVFVASCLDAYLFVRKTVGCEIRIK